jgi:putative hydrolase of the HAD superfamily
MKNIKHIFFDLDRTLWDFEANSKKALEEIYISFNLDKQIDHFNHFHHSYLRINADLWQKYGKKKISKEELRDSRFKNTLKLLDIYDEKLAEEISQTYIDLSPKKTQLFPGTIETLKDLSHKGYKMHIITNGFVEVQYIKLKESKLDVFFDVIVCSEHIGHTKPDKRIFNHALDLAKAKASESLMIGDDLKVDILGANQVGLEAILFDPEKKHKSQAFKIIHSMNELTTILV